MIEFDEVWHMNLIGIFPSVVSFGVPFPFDQVLQGFLMPPSLMGANLFHFTFFFSINQTRGRSHEVGSM